VFSIWISTTGSMTNKISAPTGRSEPELNELSVHYQPTRGERNGVLWLHVCSLEGQPENRRSGADPRRAHCRQIHRTRRISGKNLTTENLAY
jgi:hypothetical protein